MTKLIDGKGDHICESGYQCPQQHFGMAFLTLKGVDFSAGEFATTS